VLGSLLGPIWGSLVSNYLPGDQRGQYFGWRARVVGLAGLATIAIWGYVLSAFPASATTFAFAALFLSASLFRFASLHYMTRMVDTPLAADPGSEFTFWMFLRRFRDSNFVKFIFYAAAITFGTQLAAPYFAMHMLENLGFSYLEYTAVQAAAAAAGLFAFPVWGRHADRVGNARLLKTTGLLLPLLPAAWVFARTAWELVAIELFSGFVWAGFNLAVTNFIFDAVSPPKRVRCLAYYNLINGVAIFAGATLGGYLVGHLPPVLGRPLYALFLLSAAMRLAAHLLLSRHFAEVREPTESVTSLRLLFSVLGLRPMSGRNMEPLLFPRLRPPRAPR
jgi:MFS family permease